MKTRNDILGGFRGLFETVLNKQDELLSKLSPEDQKKFSQFQADLMKLMTEGKTKEAEELKIKFQQELNG